MLSYGFKLIGLLASMMDICRREVYKDARLPYGVHEVT